MRFRVLAVFAALVVASLTAIAVASARTEATPILKGTDGPGFTISLKRNGTKVKLLKAGSYKFVIADKSTFHGFKVEQQTGGKVSKIIAPVPFLGTKTLVVKLKAGKWKFYCPNHESSMFGFFTVK